MNKWRPDNWKNPYRNKKGCWEGLVFERGADAMLEALREKGQPIDRIERTEDSETGKILFAVSPAIADARGWLIFIPEKKAK